MKKISFLMMAKNEEDRISEAIESLLKSDYPSFELIVIDDSSSDKTYELVSSYVEKDSRVRLFKNKYIGKVKGTNYAYSLCDGELIKCIDADDILKKDYFSLVEGLGEGQSHCHAANVVSSNLDYLGKYSVNKKIIIADFQEVISKLISLPKWSWTYSRDVANKVFPIPDEMPIEDLWMSFRAKEFSSEIIYDDVPVYLYRQHAGQDYGGILNYSYDVVKLRAERSLETINIIEGLGLYSAVDFSYLKVFLNSIIDKNNLFQVMVKNIRFLDKIKLILMLDFPKVASLATRVKWKVDDFSSK